MCDQARKVLNRIRLKELGGNWCNKRVGDFLYRHHEANPAWLNHMDGCGNVVIYGGQGDSTDVIVRLEPLHRSRLEPRLLAYLHELVSRHGEVLHEEGHKKFFGVTIDLPIGMIREMDTMEVVIHTGSGTCYDQDEIAAEVMAALSGIPVYKALAPQYLCFGFVRMDDECDERLIRYEHPERGVVVEFGYQNDLSSVVVTLSEQSPLRAPGWGFSVEMYRLFGRWVKYLSKSEMSLLEGVREYPYEAHSLSGEQRSVAVALDTGIPSTFAIQIPYFCHIAFARIQFAKEVMEMCSSEDRLL